MNRPALIIIFTMIFAAAACKPSLPAKSSAEYGTAVRSFYIGLAAMQAADDERAKRELENAVRTAPAEPAAWANLGILQMRQKDFDAALGSLTKARDLAPENGKILANLAVLESQRGDFNAVRENLRKAIAIDPNDLKSGFALAEEYERQGDDTAALGQYESVLGKSPENSAVAVEVIRIAAKLNDIEKVRKTFASIRKPDEAYIDDEFQRQYLALGTSVSSGNSREVTQNIAFFRNLMLRVPDFRAAIDAVRFSKTTVGEPFTRPLSLPVPDFAPAPADRSLKFASETVADVPAVFARFVFMNGDVAPVIAYATAAETRIGTLSVPFAAKDLAAIDIDYDFRNDFVAVGERGIRFISNDGADITAKTGIPADTASVAATRVFPYDFEIDGDLDLIVIPAAGAPFVLRNNADGTFARRGGFAEAVAAMGFEAADLDEDGDMDAVFVAGGKLLYYTNERGGQFKLRDAPVSDPVSAIAVGDANGDGRLDLIAATPSGSVLRVTESGGKWSRETIFEGAASSLVAGDLDNNGALDLVTDGRIRIFESTTTAIESEALSGIASSAADANGDGRLDLAGLDAQNRPTRFINRGTETYAWQILRPRSAKAQGDQRVNSFGIGGEMEVRSGLTAQKRPIAAPQVHFGLGRQPATDLLRIIWGNGFIQAEFDLEKDQPILVKQRLTGSCPHLFAWNGSKFALVKDAAPLATSLGLRVAENSVLPVTQTEEWYKIPGEALVPKDGFYELRVTDELWETYYVDHYALVAVDHPIGSEMFVNELYPVPVPLRHHMTDVPSGFAAATDEHSNDVLPAIAELDENYLDTFREGRFQGVAEDHFVELVLPDGAAAKSPVKLIAEGWLHPTDTSLNVAISQSGFDQPRSLSLEIAADDGVWRTVKSDFGVPAGKLKTIVVDLPVGTVRARLRTNMEIFWDRIRWAPPVTGDVATETPVELAAADLAYRGFSVIGKKNDSSPEIPDYDRIATTIQRWRAIEGYYTRYGTIAELLTSSDDRYAIVASGDEIRLRFRALPPPKDGFKRDFILVGSGWIKEGDYNNLFSQTVLPLPTHRSSDYDRRPTRLEDDPVFKRNRGDWLKFHTRYVAADEFRNAMRR